MKLFGRNKRWEVRLLGGVVIAAALGGATQAWSVQSLILTNSNPAARSAAYVYSSGVSDILKMVDAKVDAEVIKAYIKNSAVPYNPSAAEVIALKDKGVPADIITALLQRGAELRAQKAQGPQYAQGQSQYPGANGPNMPMPPYPPDYGYGSDYGLYPADYGAGYPYAAYGYPPYGYWWYNSFWPYYWFPDNGFGFDRFGHHHHGDFHHFNNFNHARFQNFDFNRNPSGQFQSFSSSPFNNARFQNFDFNRRFNNGFVTPRVGVSQLGFPSRAFGPGAFAGGSASAAFIGASGGSAGMLRVPGAVTGVRTGGFAVRGGGGGGMHGGGGGGGGHR